jgi:TusA-related sulfurtransferase
MADKQLDARGLSCPEPVLLAKQAIESLEAGTIEVLVDTATSRDNVTRMATHLGCSVEVEETGDEFRLTITKG